jgi:hypothetical protein
LALAPPARAGLISWSYWQPSTEYVQNDVAAAAITLLNSATQSATDNETVVATYLMHASTAGPDQPDSVNRQPYRIQFLLRDEASGDVGTLEFSGILDGTFWSWGSDLRNEFTGDTSQSVTLGGHLYTAALTDFRAPTAARDPFGGAIVARVTVGEPALEPTPSPSVADTPEPATLLLAALGLPVVAAGQFVWRFKTV